MAPRVFAGLIGALVVTAIAPCALADVVLAPGPEGKLGALLVLGPVLARRPQNHPALAVEFALPEGKSEGAIDARVGQHLDEKAREVWQIASSASGAIDLKTALKTQGSEVTALAACVLRVTAPFHGFLSLGVDGGLAVYVDGKRLFARDEARNSFDDDELVPLELAPGDHPLVLKLHARSGGLTLRTRLVDDSLAAARGVSVVLAGDVDVAALARDLTEIRLDRGFGAHGLSPRLSIVVAGGFPRDASREVSAIARVHGKSETLFDAHAGVIPLERDGPVGDVDVLLPPIEDGAPVLADGEIDFDARAGETTKSFVALPRAQLFESLRAAESATAIASKSPAFLRDSETVVATLEHLSDRVRSYAGRGDSDIAAQLDEAARLLEFANAVSHEQDPITTLRGARRLAYRSPYDGHPSPFGLYLPEIPLDGSKKLPLIAALHGLNGKPMNMMRWFFGRDDGGHDGEWEDRHPVALTPIDAVVVTPMANFNAGYRYASEDDVMNVVRWAEKMFPIDLDRVSITGPSMGGTGTAAVAFRYASEFASAAPLCGYHSYALRGDMAGRTKRPWEVHIAEERSTVSWAENGLHLPLMIVQGTRDLPPENSGVLIDRYKSLGYSFVEDHPDEGHNVWQPTYEDMKGFQWLTQFRRPAHPSRVLFRTDSLRYDRAAWLHLLQLERSESWGDVRADIAGRGKAPKVKLTTYGVTALSLDRDEKVLPQDQPVSIVADGTTLSYDAGESLSLVRAGSSWQKGVPTQEPGLRKSRGLTGPIRDVFHEPLIVVYGTLDPRLRRANEQIAREISTVKPGWEIEYPVVADVDFDASLAASHAMILIGGASSNAVTRALDERLPIHVASDPPSVSAGASKWTGDELGTAFIYPNPDHPERYVVVIAGTTVAATLQAQSLPDLLPDYLVWDSNLSKARGQMVLGRASIRAGGTFDEAWSLPDVLEDPVKAKKP